MNIIQTLFTLEHISLVSTILVNLILIIVIGLRINKTKNNYLFLGFILSIFFWTISTLLFLITPPPYDFLSAQLFYISGPIIPVFIILFTKTFPDQKLNFSKLKLFFFLLFPILVCAAAATPGLIVQNVSIVGDYKTITYGPAYAFLFIYIILYFAAAFVVMYNKYQVLQGIQRKQVQIIFTSICFATVSALLVSLIMPTFGNFALFWAGPFFSGYMLLTISYAIVRYGFFDIKFIAAEFIVLMIWVLMFGKIFFSNTYADRVEDSIIFLVLLVSGVYILKGIVKEVALRQKLEKTNIELQALDVKKTEFMTLATHQLRAPLTAMKGYSSMILDGTFGKINNPEIEDAVNKISRSTIDLTMIVEDYLNNSKIELGRMQYNFANLDLVTIINSIVSELKPIADRIGLDFKFNVQPGEKFIVNIDEGKIKQVLVNVIDNAIKYTPKGHVYITLENIGHNKALVVIEDTGVGINSEILPSLFNKFVRAPESSRINVLGTGLGLYVAGEILKAHNGRAWAESDGEGKGSKFYIEIGLV